MICKVRKKALLMMLVFASSMVFAGCNDIQIFEKEKTYTAETVKDNQLKQEVYYVKNGTNFSSVYMPLGNADNLVKTLKPNRVMYMVLDNKMVPVHYKGELVAYASQKADLKSVVLERFKDLGYSVGIYGGKIEDDGYYHISMKNNTAEGSDAHTLLQQLISDEIRIISIGGSPINEWVDQDTGVIKGLEQDKYYTLELYSGTYYYKVTIKADTHFLGAFEIYNYDKEYISDTKNNYMCFNTPEELLSGYYNINGSGIFLYHEYERGQEKDNENLNVSYYSSLGEQIAAYSKQYTVSVPTDTRNMVITVGYLRDSKSDDPEEIFGYVVAPDGTGYEMSMNDKASVLTLDMARAMAGEWTVNISPQSLTVLDVSISSSSQVEETVLKEAEFIVEKDTTYMMFYADVKGQKTGEVYGSIIGPEGITYNFSIGTNKELNDGSRYMYYKLPYVKAGKYTVKIYHYQSETDIQNIQMISYNESGNDIIIIE